jgi:hypothetical protein
MIGVNESGKTNLLLPLWKLKPAREGDLVPVSDYPKSMYGTIRESPEKYIFVSALFDTADIAAELSRITNYTEDHFSELIVSRRYNGNYTYSFPRSTVSRSCDGSVILSKIEGVSSRLAEMTCSSKDEAYKSKCLGKIGELIDFVQKRSVLKIADLALIEENLEEIIPANPARTNIIVPMIVSLHEEISSVRASISLKAPTDIDGVWDFIYKSIPNFIYYSNYGNLDSEIYLPHVVDNMKRTDLGAREAAKARTLRVLFRFVRLSPEEILELGQEDSVNSQNGRRATVEELEKISAKKRERSTLLQSAGTTLTKHFKDWWKQGDYRFRFEADGNFFQIWVSDDRRPDEVELEGRSTGLQWFLSFYLVFLVESQDEHLNSILLLDEPGISLHPLAQRDLSAFFDNLSRTNQLIYTTHSPFLVDADHLDRVRKVYVDGDGKTRATEDLRQSSTEASAGASYAVSSALNLSVSESLLIGCQPVIVEGPSDQHYLTAIKTMLISANKISPPRELVFPPSGGTKTIRSIASILLGRDERLPKILLDADAMGTKMRSELSTSLYADQKEDIISLGDFTSTQHAEIEDLFPPQFIAPIVDRLFRGRDDDFEDVLVSGDPIVGQIEVWAKRNRLDLNKGWKVDLAKRVKQQCLTKGVDHFDEKTVTSWIKLFEAMYLQKQ